MAASRGRIREVAAGEGYIKYDNIIYEDFFEIVAVYEILRLVRAPMYIGGPLPGR